MATYASLTRHKWSLPFEVVMAVTAAVMLAQGNWKHFAISVFTCAAGFAPLLFEHLVRVRLPTLVHALYTGFIFISMFAGEVLGMYARIWEWDDATHFISGLLVGLGGVLLVGALGRGKSDLPPWAQALFVTALAALVAVVWEIVEFGSDQLFGTDTQGNDLTDTMMDLIEGVAGGLIIALGFAAYAKGKVVRSFGWLIESYARLNR